MAGVAAIELVPRAEKAHPDARAFSYPRASDKVSANEYRCSFEVATQNAWEEKMSSDRREFMQLAGATAAVAGTAWAATPATAQTAGQFRTVKALAFDAYGTLFDVFSVTALCEQLYPGKGNQLAQIWRVKQLQYSLMRSLMGRHRDFWGLTEDGLVWASRNLQLDLTPEKKKQLMDAYLSLAAFPDVKPGLEALKKQGVKLAILSNGEPKMLEAAAKSAGIRDFLDEIISRGSQNLQGQPPRLQSGSRAYEGHKSGTRVHLGELLGHQRRCVGRLKHLLDPAQHRRGPRGTGLPGERCCQGDYRSCTAVARLKHIRPTR
jgi:2-haloalkanoic acid dehalogenase type II